MPGLPPDLDLDEWAGLFEISFVPAEVMHRAGEAVALHRLTWWGPRLGMGEWEVWISEDCRPWARYLILHECVENWLRRQGWRYSSSHQEAVRVERRAFGDEPEWDWYMKNV